MEFKDEKELVKMLKVLANPLRLKILASLSEKPKSIYKLARELNKPYPLVHIYLTSLKKLGLIKTVRVERRSKSLPPVRYYTVNDFKITITPEIIRRIVGRGEK